MTKTDGMHDKELSTELKINMLRNWIEHIKTMGNQSLSIIYIEPLTRN